MKTSIETKKCKWREELHLTDKQGKEGKRIVWCCHGRTGIFLKSWRCVGWGHALCPLSAQQNMHPTWLSVRQIEEVKQIVESAIKGALRNPPCG